MDFNMDSSDLTSDDWLLRTNYSVDLISGGVGSCPIALEHVIPYAHPEEMTKPWIVHAHFIPIVMVYSLCVFFGSIGNVLVMYAMQCSRSRSATGLFLVSLAVADILLLLSAAPDVASYFQRSVQGGNVSCKAVGFGRMLSAFSTVLNLMAITVERFIVIVLPMRSRQLCTMKNCKKLLVVVWSLAVLMALPSLFTWEVLPFCYGKLDNDSRIIEESIVTVIFCEEPSADIGAALSIYHMVCLFLLPLLVQTACYGRMILALWSSTARAALTSHSGGGALMSGKYSHSQGASSDNSQHYLMTAPRHSGQDSITGKLVISNDYTPLKAQLIDQTGTNTNGTAGQQLNQQEFPTDYLPKKKHSNPPSVIEKRRSRTGSLAFDECSARHRVRVANPMRLLLKWQRRRSDLQSHSVSNNSVNQLDFSVDGQPLKQQASDLKSGRRQVIKMLLAVNFAFIICWGPLVVFEFFRVHSLIATFGQTEYVAKHVVKLLPYLHSCLNPIIYGFMSQNFRKTLRKACSATKFCSNKKLTGSIDDMRIRPSRIISGQQVTVIAPCTPKSTRRGIIVNSLASL